VFGCKAQGKEEACRQEAGCKKEKEEVRRSG
jgi:hypothetical protein